MMTAHDLIIDQFAPALEQGARVSTWYAQGPSDNLGDRLLMFDNTSAPSWEILRFKPAIASHPPFEAALRQRVERLRSFHHPAFPLVRPIKELGLDDGLAVVSTYVSGVCLSEALNKPRAVAFALRLIRQLLPALAAFHQHAPGIAHGALTVDRIVLTAEGRLMIREHMVGSGLESLEWPAERLWTEFGIVTLASERKVPALDDRCDLMQLGLVALSLLAGRRLGTDEYPDRIGTVLDEIGETHHWYDPIVFHALRAWLLRALQLDEHGFDSAREAGEALADLPDGPAGGDDQPLLHLTPLRAGVTQDDTRPVSSATSVERQPGLERARSAEAPAPARTRVRPLIRWAGAAVAVLALVEGAYIARLLYFGSDRASPQTAGVTTSPPAPSMRTVPVFVAAHVESDVPEIRPAVKEIPSKAPRTSAGDPETTSAPARSGGIRVSASIELHVLDGERVLGSSADGPIMVPAGQQDLEFVNSVIGYRVRQVVDVKRGQVVSLSVPVPNGTLNINATPWAEVWIDGNPLGETPLGGLSVVPGEHEIVFRHPQLGERRERAIVRPEATTRVAVNLQR